MQCDTLRIIIDLHVFLFYVFLAARINKFVLKKNVRSYFIGICIKNKFLKYIFFNFKYFSYQYC